MTDAYTGFSYPASAQPPRWHQSPRPPRWHQSLYQFAKADDKADSKAGKAGDKDDSGWTEVATDFARI